ncbi:TPA: flagellar protein FlgN [Kluyvera cryocrescens]|uniref:FlgN protein n=1 Tax=Kluyvera cryocrescens TaxID=580 RepID=A0A2X3DPL9_KLUCR|nr:flagellar protein FlgN [Kluyvera cryocrescens]MEB6634636.1 flagellar protein FlgN [Kluyvera cryocrescens]MEB7714573.1 flagellar protein FlgN [Kluyvera cryocrescens]WNN71869.1 flagellar protein FlgN [Kluyvera cryocrescens]SQC31568.1 FlgN protein [Kluyvera cryocrescens]VFS61160.1 FlgN protein [Kluyvera cryocrescens]
MTNATQRVKTLIQDMAEDRKHYHTLTTLLEKQRHHIVARDAAALDALNVQIMAQYQLLSQSSQQRYQILSQLGIDANTQGMQALIARLPEAHRASVSALWQGLQQQASDCQTANEYNGALLSMQQDILNNMLNTSEPENWLYQQG